ncbi:sarcosine oxidase subunit gamma [Dermabacter vaginalis]|uniref:sarcosine oxidase subunit gamma n=1 Tax=Dermabacter vaginalis TaxID=1630135 RepID=UPI001EF6B06D|nr:sarcosine oxidase subunit gamma family protein [Dermabacter vaginalis]MCG7443761.1 sarcosine oxidase subunit gamma [Dermabacter vaginalis]
MANAQLKEFRVTPAAHLAKEMESARVCGSRSVALTELDSPLQVGLRAKPGSESARALESLLGFALPSRVGEVTGRSDASHVLWLSPDEFLYVDPSDTTQAAAADLEASLEGLPGHAVDLSANRTVFELSGRASEELLEKGCNADLHPREFPAGRAIATQLAHVPILLHRVEQNVWRLYPRASYADFVARWIIDAMTEYRQSEVF